MSYSQLILRDSAEIVWPLDDISISSSYSHSINFYSNTASAYSTLIDFNKCDIQNIPMIFGGNSSLILKSSSVCFSIPSLGRFSDLYKDKQSVFSFWIKIDSLSNIERPIFKKRNENYCGLFIKDNYLIFKFGTEEDHSLIIGELINPDEPHLIVLTVTPSFRSMMIDSQNCRIFKFSDNFPEYTSNPDNDFIDFYGPGSGEWSIDCPAFFPNILEDSTIKRHYVYGLGKWAPYDMFYSRGGTIYNFTNISTERNYSISWDFPKEWRLTEYEDLHFTSKTVESIKFNEPEIFTFDSNITTDNNEIKFRTASNTKLSYIDVDNIQSKIGDKSALFIKYKIPEESPDKYIKQRLASIGRVSDIDILNIDLLLDDSGLNISFYSAENDEEVLLPINYSSLGDEFYIGFKFDNQSYFYLLEQSGPVQTASFNYLNSEGYGQDPLRSYYPFSNNTILRIGATLLYDLKTTTPSSPFDLNQFKGTFSRLVVVKNSDILNIDSIDYLDNYKKTRFSFSYLSQEKRFKVSTYGSGEFYLHSIDLGNFISDNDQRLSANIIEIGYPDIPSSSAVKFYVTQENYSGSVVHQKTLLKNKNFLYFINNKNISGTRLKFNFEIYSDDRVYYPPKVQHFKMETFGEGEGKLLLRDRGAPAFYIYPSSSSMTYLPEITMTPNIFLKNNSGVTSNENIIDFYPDIFSEPLNPTDISGMILWLDARFPNGFRKTQIQDDFPVTEWTDLSGNGFSATSSSSTAPIYRSQSLNLFTLNQLTGSDFGELNYIYSNNSTLESSVQSISGPRSIAIIPNGTSTDSYIEFYNSASISTFPNQEYTVVGSIKLDSKQTASALSNFSRKIVVLNNDGSGYNLVAQSAAIANVSGIYSASVKFSTSSATISSIIRFYNGSFSQDDIVYWDNLGLYPVSSSSVNSSGGTASIQNIINTWVPPLSSNDSPTIKFNGESSFINSGASANSDYTMYIVGRVFNDSGIISSSSFSLSVIDNDIKISGNSASSESNNLFNIYTIIKNDTNTKILVNGLGIGSLDSNIIDYLNIGKDINNNYLSGDISAVLLYSGAHDYITRSAIENWLDESFNLNQTVIGLTQLNDSYTDTYNRWYLNN